jgi:hypothetical protein
VSEEEEEKKKKKKKKILLIADRNQVYITNVLYVHRYSSAWQHFDSYSDQYAKSGKSVCAHCIGIIQNTFNIQAQF